MLFKEIMQVLGIQTKELKSTVLKPMIYEFCLGTFIVLKPPKNIGSCKYIFLQWKNELHTSSKFQNKRLWIWYVSISKILIQKSQKEGLHCEIDIHTKNLQRIFVVCKKISLTLRHLGICHMIFLFYTYIAAW